MPSNTFISTGILNGQPVEAFQVSQSVDAFTAQKDYRITQTGSYTLSGSLNMSGSFVNEFTGQFTTLGLGVAAPTAPTMLHIKDTDAGGDPIVLLEGSAGTDNARIRFSNGDVMYDVGAYGAGTIDDDFQVVQDATGTPKIPIVSAKDVASYTLFLSDTKVGIGLGSGTATILTPLDAGSLQASGMVSGSKVIGQTISASAAGPLANIHGTASHAINVITAETGSYVKFENVDTFYSASGQANFSNNISTIQTASAHIFKFGKLTSALVDNGGISLVSGSGAGTSYFGNYADGSFLKLISSDSETHLNSDGELYLYAATRTINKNEFRVSGSGTPQLIVGPPVGNIASNNPSASLKHDALEFHKSNAVYVGNYDTDSLSTMNIVGGGNESAGISVSSSTDITFKVDDRTNQNKVIIDTGNRNYAVGLAPSPANFSTGSYMEVGDFMSNNGAPKIQYFNISSSQVGTTDGDKILWELNTGTTNKYNGSTISLEVDAGFGVVSNNQQGGFTKVVASFGISSGGGTTQHGATTTLIDQPTSTFNQAAITITQTGTEIQVKGTDDSAGNIFWSGWVTLRQFFNTTGA